MDQVKMITSAENTSLISESKDAVPHVLVIGVVLEV